MISLSLPEARRIAISASAIHGRFSTVADAVEHLRVVQLDAVNVVGRAHAFTLATRVEGQSIAQVDRDLWEQNAPVVFEAPIHAASLAAISSWPEWAFRREAIRNKRLDWAPSESMRTNIIARLHAEGPLSMKALRGGETASDGWAWGPVKEALEHMVWTGEIICVRRKNWLRMFDLPERALPASILATRLSDDDGLRTVVANALKCLGVATTKDLSDYLRLKDENVEQALASSEIQRVHIDGFSEPAWIDPDAQAGTEPAEQDMNPLLVNPFDNLVWYRPRVKRLFGIDYRFEAYKPAQRREHGYYTLLLLVKDAFVGRADLKKKKDALHVEGVWFESQNDYASMQTAIVNLSSRLETFDLIPSDSVKHGHQPLVDLLGGH